VGKKKGKKETAIVTWVCFEQSNKVEDRLTKPSGVVDLLHCVSPGKKPGGFPQG